MKRRNLAILIFLLLLSFGPGQNKARAIIREHHYVVYYTCIVSPDMRGTIMGEWTYHCDGTWDGWGWWPGANCSDYYEYDGDFCGDEEP